MSRKFKFDQNLTRIMDTLHEHQYTFMIISSSILLQTRNVLTCPPPQIVSYEIMWKNIVQPDYGHTLIILNAFPLQQQLHKCTLLLHYMYTACLAFYLLYHLLLPNLHMSCTYRYSRYRFCDSELPVGPTGVYISLSLHQRVGIGPGFGMYSFLNTRRWTELGNLITPTTLKTPYTISLLLPHSIKLFFSLFRLF